MSAFQKRIRGGATKLRDHICKEMNALNLERCRCIPKNVPGADWRVLQQIVAADPSREKFQVPPHSLAAAGSSTPAGSCIVKDIDLSTSLARRTQQLMLDDLTGHALQLCA